MIPDVDLVITWMLFLALFPMAFIWLRRAYKIFIKKDYSEVALKGGEPPSNPKKWAPATGMVNLIAGSIALITILGVLIGYFHYQTWTTMAGSTIWLKIFADFIVSRQAHPMKFGRKKKNEQQKTK